MEEPECPPVTVEGDWTPDQNRTVRNKLHLYFQSKKKSSGGDCRVEAGDGAPRAAVFFRCEQVRERVLARQNHEILLGSKTVKLRLSSASSSTYSDNVSDSKPQKSEPESSGASAGGKDEPESDGSAAVVLDNVGDNMSTDLLSMLVENVSGLDESCYSLEIIWEASRAVVTFNEPADAERFLTVSQSSQKLQKHRLSVRPLEAADCVRVESLPPKVVKDILELYFEKSWVLPDDIVMIPNEQAAIAKFNDPKVVESICLNRHHVMRSIPVEVYPYYESLGTALYGKERPSWRMPEPFTESVHHVVWKFLQMKKLFDTINDQMRPYFCCVDLESSEAKLSPLPSLLKQKGLTAEHINKWQKAAQDAFREQMSQYSAFDCQVNAQAWKAAEKDVRSVVKDDAVLMPDASRGIVAAAGRAEDIKQIKAPVENIILKAMRQVKRQTESVSEVMDMSPSMFYILQQEGLQKAVQDISPDINLAFNEGAQKLSITGLSAEVFQTKSWILEKNIGMSKKQLNVLPHLLDFLKTVDPMEMSQDLFTSQGISAIYSIENKGVFLVGSSESVLTAAENKMKLVLAVQTLDVEDKEVLNLPSWAGLNKQLFDTYNSSKKKTVAIQVQPERGDKIMVAGFQSPVKEVSHSLTEFIRNYSRVQEAIRVESYAVVQFIDKKKTEDWTSIAKANDVKIHFDPQRPKITFSGARLHVHKAKSCFQELANALSTDIFTVVKPGAKKYFQTQGSTFLSSIMSELSCVVVLRPENQDEEEEEENYEVENGLSYCKVKTASGILVSVSMANICSFGVDAVVNAANEDLQHIGGLALALLKAAGPELQNVSNDHVAKNGKLRPGDAITTGAFNLPCKYVVHTVGPRFSDFDRRTAVSRLKMAVKNSLKQAENVRCSSIALPAISSGVFGFPVDLCAETVAQAVREYCDSPGGPGSLTEIHLVDNNDNTVRVLASAVNTEFNDLGPTMTVTQTAGGSSSRAPGRPRLARSQSESPISRRFGAGGARGGARGGGARGGARGAGSSLRGAQSNTWHRGSGRVEQTTAEGLKIILHVGNIEEQNTDVIVNTISEDMNLNQGAVSKAILAAAGPRLQAAVRTEAGSVALPYGDVVITDGFGLKCQKVFHTVCPYWNNGNGQAEEELISIIRYCLEEAEKGRMTSLSFPAIGTGNLSFPSDVVSRVLLQEIHAYSGRQTPRHLREVFVVVHPGNSQTVDCFTRQFKGQTIQRNVRHEAQEVREPAVRPSARQSQQSTASFGPVSSPSLGVYRMQMGQLALEVSSGDITKEACDVIINSSNQDFTLQSGVSKAILDGAGFTVQLECSKIVSSAGYQQRPFILTSAGLLPSRNIIHVVGTNNPSDIKDLVYAVLKHCEENQLGSVAFPALGTGQGGASPAAVADAMVDALVDFVRKKHRRHVRSVKILIFQTAMMAEFHRSMKRREGEEVEEKSVLTRIKNFFLGAAEERPSPADLVLEREEFEPTVFQLCADSSAAVKQAKRRIGELIVAEQAERTITDKYIGQLSQADLDQLKALQRKLTVSIRLDQGKEDQEPRIHLEGLTRDVYTAESEVRDIIRKVERAENLRTKALMMSGLVEWQYVDGGGATPFDIYTNLSLEEALGKKQQLLPIKINNVSFDADVVLRRAVEARGRHRQVELLRRELKDDAALPPHWADMKGDLLRLVPVAPGSNEFRDVVTELTKTGLAVNIISVDRVQNVTLWQSYQLLKKQMEVKNKHTNNERILFHGTGANAIDLINKQGFNRSYAGAHGAAYGNGSYFAVNPAYSAQGYAQPDASGHKRLYKARVLVGDFTTGRGGMITPPSKNSRSAADLFDSVADKQGNPSIFVVFNDIQAYPEYLITFT